MFEGLATIMAMSGAFFIFSLFGKKKTTKKKAVRKKTTQKKTTRKKKTVTRKKK